MRKPRENTYIPSEYPCSVFEHPCSVSKQKPCDYTGFYTNLNVWGSLGLNFEYDGGPIIEIGGPIFLYKLRILKGSTSFREGSVLSPGQ